MENEVQKKITWRSTLATWRRIRFRENDLVVIADKWSALPEDEKEIARALASEQFDRRLAKIGRIIRKRLKR